MVFQLPDPSTPFGERVARRLRDERLMWLTTVDANGTPQPTPIWFLWDEATSTFLIYSRSDPKRLEHFAKMSGKVTCKEKKDHMKPRQYGQLLIVLVLFVAACSNESSAVSVRRTSTPTRQATPTSTQVVHVAQQPLPKGLLNSAYP